MDGGSCREDKGAHVSTDYTTRFSVRAPYYHRHRPRYPQGVLRVMEGFGLTPRSIIADVGAGTGISSELFLNYGATVYAVEPNPEMRAVAEHYYDALPNCTVINGTAETTTLPTGSVDFVVAGQAFHWFDHRAARVEFRRILRPGGHVVLMWSYRKDGTSAFIDHFNAVLEKYDTDKAATPRAKGMLQTDEDIAAFFGAAGFEKAEIPNPVVYDWDGLRGRALSASYVPLPGHPDYDALITDLRAVFDRHQVDGKVTMEYITQVYWGKIG